MYLSYWINFFLNTKIGLPTIKNYLSKNEICSICLENNVNCILTCNHKFHYKCIFSIYGNNCPYCRTEINIFNFKKNKIIILDNIFLFLWYLPYSDITYQIINLEKNFCKYKNFKLIDKFINYILKNFKTKLILLSKLKFDRLENKFFLEHIYIRQNFDINKLIYNLNFITK